MSAIEVEGPDGAVHEFPAGTSPDVIKGAMAKAYGAPKPAAGDAGAGAAALRGVSQGATLGFSDEMAGAGANSPLPGADAVKKTTFGALSAPDVLLGAISGLFKGDSGKAAYEAERDRIRAGNETAQKQHPLAYGGGQVAGGILSSGPLAGAAVGATAGATVARGVGIGAGLGGVQGAGEADTMAGIPAEAGKGALIGGLIGGAVPAAIAGARRVISPLPITPERQALVNTLENEGINLTAGQRTGSKPLQWAESALGDMPGAGGRASAIQRGQAQQFTEAALRRTGTNAELATPDVIDAAFTRIGQQFDDLASRNTMRMDPQFAQDFGGAVRDYVALVPPSHRVPMVDNTVNDIIQLSRTGGQLDGAAYQTLRSRLDRIARGTSDNQLRTFASDVRNALDTAMERSIPAGSPDAGAWREVRRQYRNMIPLEKAASRAGEMNAQGYISPSNLRNAIVQQNPRAYVRGNGDYADLARAGEAIMKPLPNSGTAPRQNVQNLISALSGGGGAAVAGLPGALAGAAAPGVAGRVLFSPLVQQYLANQRATGPVSPSVQQLVQVLLGAPARELSVSASHR